jgi:hypothetical protein
VEGAPGVSVPPKEMGLLIALGVASDNAHDPAEKRWLEVRILHEMCLNLKLYGNEVYYTA